MSPSQLSDITFKMTQDQHEMISMAAKILGVETEDFVIRVALERSLTVIKTQAQSGITQLTQSEQQQFSDLLWHPPEASNELRLLMSLTPIPER